MALTVLLGGARSGKSAIAVSVAAAQRRPVVVIATAEALDTEMAERIRRHRADRPSGWQTIEEPLQLGAALRAAEPASLAIVDCLTLWVTNGVATHGQAWVLQAAQDAVAAATSRPGPTIVISNEVGSGIVPFDQATRAWRDLLGRVNADFCRVAQDAFLVVAGRVLRLADASEIVRG
jgi:adenosyl cobinamide kinase/adenosyl cobinamide phosphate guanylyltransferase